MINREVKKFNMSVLYESMADMLQPLTPAAEPFVEVWAKFKEEQPWNWFPLIVSYCFGIPESKDISAVKHGGSGQRSCASLLPTMVDICVLR